MIQHKMEPWIILLATLLFKSIVLSLVLFTDGFCGPYFSPGGGVYK